MVSLIVIVWVTFKFPFIEPLPLTNKLPVFIIPLPLTNKLPVITALPLNGNPVPLPPPPDVNKAYEAVIAYIELLEVFAYDDEFELNE